jgi:hypothetical protein
VGVVLTITALDDVVLSELCGVEVASDWTKVTAVPLVLCGVSVFCLSLLGQTHLAGLDLSPFLPRVKMVKRS